MLAKSKIAFRAHRSQVFVAVDFQVGHTHLDAHLDAEDMPDVDVRSLAAYFTASVGSLDDSPSLPGRNRLVNRAHASLLASGLGFGCVVAKRPAIAVHAILRPLGGDLAGGAATLFARLPHLSGVVQVIHA